MPAAVEHQRSPSLLSEVTWEQEQNDEKKDKVLTEPNIPNTYDLREWQASKVHGFKDSGDLQKFYN